MTAVGSTWMSHNSLVSGPNVMIWESYESLRSLFSNEKSFTGFTSHLSEIVCTSQIVKTVRFDILAFEADLKGQMKS